MAEQITTAINHMSVMLSGDNYEQLKDITFTAIDQIQDCIFIGQVPCIEMICDNILYFDEIIKDVIEYARQKDSMYSIIVSLNHIGLSKEQVSYINDNAVRVNLTLHSDNIVNFISDCHTFYESNISNIFVNIVIDQDSAMNISDCVAYFDSWDLQGIDFKLNSKQEWSNLQYDEFRKAYHIFAKKIIDTFEDYDIPLVPYSIKQMFVKKLIAEYEEKRHYRRRNRARCGCKNERLTHFYINADGEIFLCPNIDDRFIELFIIGNIYDGVDTYKTKNLIDMASIDFCNELNRCNECPLDLVCNGGCTAEQYPKHQTFGIISNDYCMFEQITYEVAIALIKYFEIEKSNELFKDFFYGSVIGGVHHECR